MEAQPRRIGRLPKREYDTCPKNDGIARPRPNGDEGRWQLYLAEFTHEEIADKLGVDRSVVRRDLQSFRDVCRSGDSPILRWRALLRWQSGNGDRYPTRCMRLRPGTLHPGASPPFRTAIASRGDGRILER
jgi:hypothetical protein